MKLLTAIADRRVKRLAKTAHDARDYKEAEADITLLLHLLRDKALAKPERIPVQLELFSIREPLRRGSKSRASGHFLLILPDNAEALTPDIAAASQSSIRPLGVSITRFRRMLRICALGARHAQLVGV